MTRHLAHNLALLIGWLLAATAAVSSGTAASEDDEIVVGPIAANAETQLQQFGFPNFDQLLFQDGGNAKQSETRMQNRIELQLAEIDRVCQLSEPQKQKLQLAARGDRQRLLSEAAMLRLKFEKLMKGQKGNDPNAFNEVWQQMHEELQPLQMRMARGLTFDPKSLFMKVLPKTLTAEQQKAYDAVASERLRFRYEASVASSLHQLDDVVVINEKQREGLTTVLLAMPPPKQSGQYNVYVIWMRLGMVPEEKLKPLFNADQWKTLKAHLDQFKNIRQGWIDAGIIDAEDFDGLLPKEMP